MQKESEMSDAYRKIKDSFMKNLVKVNGIHIPEFSIKDQSMDEHIGIVKEMEVRDDDIFVLGYPKCGTHWVWEIINMLVHGNTEYDKRTKEAFMLEATPQEDISVLESPRTLNSHLWFRSLPKQIFTRKPRIVFVVRNPKDVCVSSYCHWDGIKEEMTGFALTFQDFLKLFLEGDVDYDGMIDYLHDCEDVISTNPDLPVLFLPYEVMKKDPVENIKQIAKFIGVEASDDFCSAVADACSFQKLKKADSEIKTDPFRDCWKEGAIGMYRKGIVGDWKNWLTVAENEEFDRILNEKMKNSKLCSRYLQQ